FLLYVAGVYRHFIWAGRLGLHRPQMEHKPIGTTEKDASAAAEEMRDKIKLYFEEMNVPSRYLDFMYSAPPNEVRWLPQNQFNSDVKGYAPEVRALLEARCTPHFSEKQSKQIDSWLAQTNAELRFEAWNNLFRHTSE